MLSKRTWVGFGIGAMIVAGLANIKWVDVKREIYMEGGVMREYRILGRFDYTSNRRDGRIRVSQAVSKKFSAYGLNPPAEGDVAIIDKEPSRTEFTTFKESDGDVGQESAQIAKQFPWLSQVWSGSRRLHLYARGHHPKLGGFVEITCSRLPEKKHGPNKLRFSISITE